MSHRWTRKLLLFAALATGCAFAVSGCLRELLFGVAPLLT